VCLQKEKGKFSLFTEQSMQEISNDESFQSSASKKSKTVDGEDSDAIDSEREDPGTEQKSKIK
jgi:hypothetical protein